MPSELIAQVPDCVAPNVVLLIEPPNISALTLVTVFVIVADVLSLPASS